MIKVNCSICEKELDKPGALLFTPPFERMYSKDQFTVKYHICVSCFTELQPIHLKMHEEKIKNG